MKVVWSDYLTGSKCPICRVRIREDELWLNCDGWAEHQACHDADAWPDADTPPAPSDPEDSP